MKIEKVPSKFQTKPKYGFPYSRNTILFEEYFHHQIQKENFLSNFTYLPIYFTHLYNQNKKLILRELDQYLQSLDPSKYYITILQHDHGIINNIKHLQNLIVFSSGNVYNSNFIIPLNCIPLDIKEYKTKDIFCSFVGNSNTHRYRKDMMNILQKEKGFFLSESLGYEPFKEVLLRSIWTLTIRGYGITSFRICEALQALSIPIYIYDIPAFPFQHLIDPYDYMIPIHYKKMDEIPDILQSFNKKGISKMMENGYSIYQQYFTYQGCYSQILKIIKDIENGKLEIPERNLNNNYNIKY